MRLESFEGTKPKEKQNKRRDSYTVGTSLVLVTFVLLALVVFATLSYSQARADLKLSEDAAATTTRYYEAETQAQAKLSDINTKVMWAKINMLDEETFGLALEEMVANDEVTITPKGGNTYITYRVECGDDRYLQVELKVKPFDDFGEGKLLEVVTWRTATEDEEEGEDETLHLMF